MAIHKLATFNYPLYEMRTVLDGREYILMFDYNGREDRWYMTISDVDNVPIYRGVKLVINTPLLIRCADRRKPTGELLVAGPNDPGFADWGPEGQAVLYYYDASEVQTALGN